MEHCCGFSQMVEIKNDGRGSSISLRVFCDAEDRLLRPVCAMSNVEMVERPDHQLHLRMTDRGPCVLVRARYQGKMKIGLLGFGFQSGWRDHFVGTAFEACNGSDVPLPWCAELCCAGRGIVARSMIFRCG